MLIQAPSTGSVRLRVAAAFCGCALAAALAVPLPAGAAVTDLANPVLTVTPDIAVAPTGPTTVTVTGTDYLVPPHAPGSSVFGGVYVFFGWVDTSTTWGPSARNVDNTDGALGVTYLYPGAAGGASTRDAGSGTRFVSFTPSGESGAAASSSMDRAGNWTATLTVPGASFTTALPSGATRTTNCLVLTCGVYTIGAHGKVSATNEKFTPIEFGGQVSQDDADDGSGDVLIGAGLALVGALGIGLIARLVARRRRSGTPA